MESFGISEGNITRRQKKKSPQSTWINCGEVAQMLTSTTSKQGLNREVQGALLRVKNGPECLEDNLKELI